jgi:hypothetical protein
LFLLLGEHINVKSMPPSVEHEGKVAEFPRGHSLQRTGEKSRNPAKADLSRLNAAVRARLGRGTDFHCFEELFEGRVAGAR